MDIADYWPMAREYSIWNATIASLQFWTADLDMITLGTTIEEVYLAFFKQHQLIHYVINLYEILFSGFVTTLNVAFEQKLALEDEGYESGSEIFNMPTPLRKMPKIHHISSIKNASFNPNLVTPHSIVQSHLRLVHRWLAYSSSDDSDTSEEETLTAPRTTPDTQVHLDEDDKEEEWYLWMTNIGLLRKCLTELYAYMNMPYHMGYAHICALM